MTSVLGEVIPNSWSGLLRALAATVFVLAATVFVLATGACARGPETPLTQRLVDVFSPQLISGSPAADADLPAPAEWRFDDPSRQQPTAAAASGSSTTRGWQAYRDVVGLEVRAGRLAGSVTSGTSVVRLRHAGELDSAGLLHEARVRLRVSAGTEASLHLIGPEPSDGDRAMLDNPVVPWLMRAPVTAGEELVTCVFKSPLPVRGAEIEQILLRPSDVAGASFAVESVRLVFRREHLAAIPSGVGWQGLSEIYRETVVARAPEIIRWQLTLPERPFLDLALGTLDERPVTFAVTLHESAGHGGRLLERTVSTARRWDSARIDLAAFSGRRITLELSLHAEAEGALGLWGSPAVRQAGAPRSAEAEQPPRGVIFILADTLRPDRLEAYGHQRATAPALARLAEQGARFADTVAQGTWTKVSAPSIMSSLYPLSNGVRDFPDRLPSSATTMAEVFRQAGYATIGYSSVPFTGTFNNLHQGYEIMHETFDPEAGKTARGFVDRLLPWLDRHREVPFFVFLHLFDPHSPFRPESPWDSLWAPSDRHRQHLDRQQQLRPFIQHPMRRLNDMPNRDELEAAGLDPEAFIGHELDWYDGSIRGMDVEVGRVLERLRELGLEQRTLVAFASDHGEEFLDHGRTFHGHSVYGELAQVPLILRYPDKVPAGITIDETVQMIDLMPTILELSGLPSPAGIQGQSTVSLLSEVNGRPWKPRPAISEKPAGLSQVVPPPIDIESIALIFEGWKLIHNHRPAADKEAVAAGSMAERPPLPEYQLYDHRLDPLDQTDVAEHNPRVVERLARLLAGWRKTAENQRLASDDTASQGLSQQEIDRLRALGYIQ